MINRDADGNDIPAHNPKVNLYKFNEDGTHRKISPPASGGTSNFNFKRKYDIGWISEPAFRVIDGFLKKQTVIAPVAEPDANWIRQKAQECGATIPEPAAPKRRGRPRKTSGKGSNK